MNLITITTYLVPNWFIYFELQNNNSLIKHFIACTIFFDQNYCFNLIVPEETISIPYLFALIFFFMIFRENLFYVFREKFQNIDFLLCFVSLLFCEFCMFVMTCTLTGVWLGQSSYPSYSTATFNYFTSFCFEIFLILQLLCLCFVFVFVVFVVLLIFVY